jgi:hypothetical protein
MAVWQYDLTMTPSRDTDFVAVCDELSERFKELDSWADDIRIWGAMDGNRIDYLKDCDTGLLRVRIDLREPSIDFIRTILAVANRWCMKLEDDDGIQLRPTLDHFISTLKSSEAYRFVGNPTRFLEEMKDQERRHPRID